MKVSDLVFIVWWFFSCYDNFYKSAQLFIKTLLPYTYDIRPLQSTLISLYKTVIEK
jgi:hypothetical protein